MSKIIVLANQKGGVAKSSTATALSASFITHGKRVLLVDTDPQCNVTKTYQAEIQNKATLYDVLLDGYPVMDAIQHKPLGDILPCDTMLAAADQKLVDIGKEHLLRKALETAQEQYDYIVIDTPPSLGVLLINALTVADLVIIPVPAEEYAVQGLNLLSETIKKVQEYINPRLRIGGLLITRYNPRTILSRDVAADIRDAAVSFGTSVYETTIRECNAVKMAQRKQKLLFDYAPRCTAAQDYMAFAAEILKEV